MNRILVPYDFSEVAEHALNFSCQLATKQDVEILLLHVIESPTYDSLRTMGIQNIDPREQLYIKELYQVISQKFSDLLKNTNYSKLKISTKIQLGNAYKTVIDQIAEETTSLLVVGTSGSEGIVSEFFMDTNAEKIVRNAKCPVFTIHGKAEIAPLEKMVFASDFDELDDTFIHKVKALQQLLDVELNIVKINTPSLFTSTRHDTKQIEDFLKRYNINNYSTAIYNEVDEEEGIINYAEDIGADIIAIGTSQRKGIGRFFIGSIVEEIIKNAKIPVWTSSIN